MIGLRVAMTGARGRLAPALRARLGAAGGEVTVFSRSADATIQPLDSLAFPAVLGRFDAVLHLGWSSVPLISEQNPGQEQREDFPFLERLAAAAGQLATPPQMVFFSTAAVYGNTGTHPATEGSPCAPRGRYAAAKQAAEQILRPIPGACVLRVSNVFGPLATNKPQGIIPLFYQACYSGQQVTIWGDGSATKDYLHVEDFAAAVEAALRHRLAGIYNVASGCSLSLREIIALVETASGHQLARTFGDPYPWDVAYSVVSPALLTTATGWQPVHHPGESIREMMRDEPKG
jgi:UDP-glucose 4-epimerase